MKNREHCKNKVNHSEKSSNIRKVSVVVTEHLVTVAKKEVKRVIVKKGKKRKSKEKEKKYQKLSYCKIN